MRRHLLRARFHDIIAEFLPPANLSKKDGSKVMILCGGMPGMPRHGALVEFFSQKGYWTFYPRYRGSWESGGRFLKFSPEKDMIDIIDAFQRGFKDLYSGEKYRIKPSKIYIIGSSFGGPAAILATQDPRVTRVIAVSPVIDWRVPGRFESVNWLEKFTEAAFGDAYRFSHGDWAKLKNGRFYNPAAYTDKVLGEKILIFQAKDDPVVPYRPAMKFAKATTAKLVLLKRGGHLGFNFILKAGPRKKISLFLKGG